MNKDTSSKLIKDKKTSNAKMEQARDTTYVAQQHKTTSFYELHK